jgi:hypothetical protein
MGRRQIIAKINGKAHHIEYGPASQAQFMGPTIKWEISAVIGDKLVTRTVDAPPPGVCIGTPREVAEVIDSMVAVIKEEEQ